MMDWDYVYAPDDFKQRSMRSYSPINLDHTLWQTADGRRIKIAEMDLAHLANVIAYCERHDRPKWYYAPLVEEQKRRAKLEKSGKVEIRYCTYGE